MTLTARVTNWLIEHDHDVEILILAPKQSTSPNVIRLFTSKAKLHFVDAKYRRWPWYPLNLRGWIQKACGGLDVIVALSRESLFVSTALYPAFKSQPVVIAYVIDNVAYTLTNKSIIASIICKHFYRKVPDEFKMFMSRRVRDIHANSLKTKFDNSKVLILPIKLIQARKVGMPEGRRIVSIGRIDNAMKRYVFQLPEITANLKRKGFDVTCDIYGHGEDRLVDELHQVIQQHKAQDWVKFHGEVEYTRFHEVLRDCFVFVGMGTSAIEAAMFGLPTVTAVAFSEQPKSYGYLSELPLGAVGEDLEQGSTRDIETMIADLCESSEAEYLELCRKHIAFAKHYDQDEICPEMLDYFQERFKNTYRNFKMPIWRVLEINGIRGVNYLGRHLMRAITIFSSRGEKRLRTPTARY